MSATAARRGMGVDELAAELAKSVRDGIRRRFAEVIEKKKHAKGSVQAGRAYVAAYVEYAHFIESLHTISSHGAEEHQHLHAPDEHGK